jgi:hypothetical protein
VAPIEYVPTMQAYYQGLGLGDYPFYRPTGNPWAPLPKPLGECRLAVVCSAGISRRDHTPFHRLGHDDFSLREIPKDSAPADMMINYDSFDHADADINCVLPLARLPKLAAAGFIADLAPRAYAMGIGRWRDAATPERLQKELVPHTWGEPFTFAAGQHKPGAGDEN